jgi:hypothetical protein
MGMLCATTTILCENFKDLLDVVTTNFLNYEKKTVVCSENNYHNITIWSFPDYYFNFGKIIV